MNGRGESKTRVLCVGRVLAPDTVDDAEFDVRTVEAAAEARALIDVSEDTDAWYPDCVVSGVLGESATTGLDFLRWVDDHTARVATVLAPGDEGSERLASRAVTAGISGYCPADEPLPSAVETALDRSPLVRGEDHTLDRRYRTLAENLPNGAVALYDRELRYLVVEGTVFDDLPLDHDDLEGKRLEESHSDAFLDEHADRYRAALDGRHTEFEFAYEGRTFRGHTVPVRDATGTVVAGMALTQDVTDARDRQLRLERQNQRLDRFAGIVSHDLRSPLNVVEGSLVLLRDAVADGDQSGVDENVERISRACRRMSDIIDNVLTLARQPDSLDDLEEVPLGPTVRHIWRTLDTPSATLVVDTGSHAAVALRADRSALSRLLENLLTNAVEHGSTSSRSRTDDAVEHGSTRPRSQAHEVTVTVEWLDGDEPGFAVSDDGPGLTSEEREHILEWGYTTGEDGVGLGLGIVEGVADAHGWTLSVAESAAGGARFEFRGIETADCAEPAEPDVESTGGAFDAADGVDETNENGEGDGAIGAVETGVGGGSDSRDE